MNYGEMIARARDRVMSLERELDQAKNELKDLKSSCQHGNMVPKDWILKLADEEIRRPCVQCPDCGIVRFVQKNKKRSKKHQS